MQLNKQQAYRVLGIDNQATPREAKIAYLRLVKRWHPDRFSSDDNRKPEAEELIRQINLAYEKVQAGMSACQKPPAASPGAKAGRFCHFHGQPADSGIEVPQRPVSLRSHVFDPGSLKQAPNGWEATIKAHPVKPTTGGLFDDVLSEIMKTDPPNKEPG